MRQPPCRVEWSLCAALCALGFCLALGGCGAKVRMMPAPLAIRDAGMNPFALVSAEHRTPTVPVLYATNRVPARTGKSGARYGSASGEEIRLGAASVRLGGEGWDWDRLASETLAGARPAITVTRVEEFGVLGASTGAGQGQASLSAEGLPGEAESRFAATINESLASCSRKDVFVYVPGINLTFELGLRRMAEFAHYLDRDGVFLTYAWPAHTHPFAYDADRRSAIGSVDGFIRFVRFLREETDAERIHLITSSAGAPLVSGAMLALHEQHAGLSPDEMRRSTRLGQIVYAASDQDIDGFREMLLTGADAVCDHITVYSSSVDLGLVLTRHFGSGDKTIGRLPAVLTEPDAQILREHGERVTVVDVTAAVGSAGRGDLWAHRYWYLNTWVSSDLLGVLRHGMAPAGRGLVPTRDGAMWAFPDDYPSQLHADMAACPLTDQTHAAR